MKLIARQKIRFYYYLTGIVAMIFIAASMSVPYFFNLKKEYQSKIEQLSQSIISEKKRHLSDVINKTILEIEFIRTDASREYSEICADVSNFLSISHAWKETNHPESLQANLDELIQNSTQRDINNIISILVYNTNNSQVVYSSENDAAKIFARTLTSNANYRELYPAFATSISSEGFNIYVFVSKDSFENIVKNRIKDLIRAVRLGDDGYIWINQIVNYDGGDDYAIRLVHPNLPLTEGLKLSTNMQDIRGNHPYKIELEGVKRNGDLYFDYYFKKMNTDQISHKLTYAKLYKPYDWVIATGVYLDDVDKLILNEHEAMNKTYTYQIRMLGFIVFGIFAVSIVALMALERQINELISSYVHTIKEKEVSLQLEKENVDKAYSQLKNVAYFDYLTNLWNRRAMYERIAEEYSRCSRKNSTFAIIIGDIDHFKIINDTHGHECGDIVLKELSEVMSNNIRNEDSISRWGGEEFLILGTSCKLADGVCLAEKIRIAIERHKIDFKDSKLKITMTFGVAVFDPKKSIDEIIKEADEMLYLGKKKRNCVVSTKSSA
jgi:diguanylate cyclase (GGDEF)-like protein